MPASSSATATSDFVAGPACDRSARFNAAGRGADAA